MEIFSNVFAQAVALSALSVVAVQQILKLQVIPNGFANKYPVPTLIILSVIASVIAVLTLPLAPHNVSDWIILIATISVTAALTYRNTLRNWTELRALEGTGTK